MQDHGESLGRRFIANPWIQAISVLAALLVLWAAFTGIGKNIGRETWTKRPYATIVGLSVLASASLVCAAVFYKLWKASKRSLGRAQARAWT